MAELTTRSGIVRLPAFVPVTTFGRFPLDDLIRPFLPRLAPSVLVSAEGLDGPVAPLGVPLWVDSGGFAALRAEARVVRDGDLGVIVDGSRRLGPPEVLELQEACADVAFTLDLPSRREAGAAERERRLALLRRRVARHTIHDWMADIFAEVARLRRRG